MLQVKIPTSDFKLERDKQLNSIVCFQLKIILAIFCVFVQKFIRRVLPDELISTNNHLPEVRQLPLPETFGTEMIKVR